MPNTFNENTFATTYKDDYRDSDNYHRILFNSGRALQARELTQAQTIIQKELARLGRHIFKEGAVVNPGGLMVDDAYEFVKLADASPSVYPGDILTATASNGVKAEVLEVVEQTGSDPATVYVKYINAGTATSSATPIRFSAGQALDNGDESGNGGSGVTVAPATKNPVVGQGFKVSVNLGGYFTRGHFVQSLPQGVIISKYSNNPTTNVGFLIAEDIVTVADTNDLYDNQLGYANETAPGADRYRIRLTLANQEFVDSADNFIVINRFVNGIMQQEIDENDNYNIIGDELAQRTKEESGSYTVDDFQVKFRPSKSGTDYLDLEVSPGVAYVNGYRVSKPASSIITVEKPRSTEKFENENIPVSYGNYVVTSGTVGLPDISSNQIYRLYTAADVGGTVIGNCKVRAVESQGDGTYRYYIFDVQLVAGQNFRDTRSIGVDATHHANIKIDDTNSIAVIQQETNNNVFFDLPRNRPSSLEDFDLTIQRHLSQTASSNQIAFTLSGTETFVDTTLWLLVRDDSGAVVTVTPSNTTLSGDSKQVTITGLVDGVLYRLLAYVDLGAGATQRTKTKTFGGTATLTWDSDGNGIRFAELPNTDIYEFLEVLDFDSNNISSKVTTDDGQRDNFYQKGRVILRGSEALPRNNTVKVKYNYFEHTAGDFFSRNSYIGAVAYEDIPTYRMQNGFEVELRDVLDFRGVQDSASTGFDGAEALVTPLPRNTSAIGADITYYDPRNDILVVTEEGDIQYITGQPNVNPVIPSVPSTSMHTHSFALNAYTDNEDDLGVRPVDNRRYTMRDIGNIAKRIDNLEEVTSLTLLELETSSLEVLDSAGNNRFKNGFFADNFKDLAFADIFATDYSASHDAVNQLIMPSAGQNSVRLIVDSDASVAANTVRKGDFIYLSYNEVLEIDQNVATETMNINPFAVISFIGQLELSPDQDQWREDVFLEAPRAQRALRVRRRRGRNLTPRQRRRRARFIQRPIRVEAVNTDAQPSVGSLSSFNGLELGEFIDTPDRRLSSTTRTSTRRSFNRRTITTATIVRSLIGRRVVDISLLPFIRHRKVFFRGTGLAPDREHFMFFDNESMSNYVKPEAFQSFSDSGGNVEQNYGGGQFQNNTVHPQGIGALTTDAFGTVTGSFFLPNNDTLRFDAGIKPVKLLDVNTNNESVALSQAHATYEAQGVRVTLQDVVATGRRATSRTVRLPRPRNRDPLAQSFWIQNQNGGYLTSIDVYFANKPDGSTDNTPIQLELRPLRNGVPSQEEIVPGSIVTLNPNDVNTVSLATATALGEDAMAKIRQDAKTTFTFERPLYVEGNTQYAFVLIANTNNYEAYVSEIEDFLVGSNTRRVMKQPSLGSLFKSQNSITWTPDQRRDMMFRINRADFSTSGTAYLENAPGVNALLASDPIMLDSVVANDSDVVLFFPNHGYTVNDTIELSGLDSTTNYGDLSGASLLGERTVTKVDTQSLTFKADSVSTRTEFIGGAGISIEKQVIMDEVTPVIDFFALPATTTTFNGRFTDFVSMPVANDSTNVAYGVPTNGFNFIPNETIVFEYPRVVANTYQERDEATLGGANKKSVEISAALTTNDTYVSPLIDLTTASLDAVNNIIDNPVDSDGAVDAANTVNFPIEFAAETDPDGTAAAKHVTIPVGLAEAAVGLKVFVAASVPTVADIDLYYRTLEPGADVELDTVNYIKATIDNVLPKSDNRDVFREHQYTIGGLGGNLSPFTTFQLKIVMRSQNSSKVPLIKDIRAVALGT